MIRVKVDGNDFAAEVGNLRTMGELIELVKATIDPECIITSMQLQGNPLSDADWQAPLSAHGESELDIATGNKEEYLVERLGAAEQYLTQIIEEFTKAAEAYHGNDLDVANGMLSAGVDDLLAFVNWYLTLLSVNADEMTAEIEEYNGHIENIQGTCEQLLQQQMFQSWWALGETLKNNLAPQLEQVKTFCVKVSQSIASAQS